MATYTGVRVIVPIPIETYVTYFKDRVDVQLSVPVYSNIVRVIEAGAMTADQSAEFSINGEEFGTTGTVAAGDLVQLKVTSSADPYDAVVVTVSIGGSSYATWSVTTEGYADALTDGDTYLTDDESVLTDS